MSLKPIADLFSVKWDKINLSTLKKQLFLLLIFSFGMLFFFLYISFQRYFDPELRMILPAQEHHEGVNPSKFKTYHSLEFEGYSYVTGTEGELYYKPKTIIQAIFLNRIGNKTIIDYFVYALIGVIIFFNLRRTTDTQTFSRNLINLFFWTAFSLFMLLPMLNFLFQEFVSNPLLIRSTNNQFELDNKNLMDLSAVPLIIILILLFFLKKGFELQEEQELTV